MALGLARIRSDTAPFTDDHRLQRQTVRQPERLRIILASASEFGSCVGCKQKTPCTLGSVQQNHPRNPVSHSKFATQYTPP